MPRGKGAKSGSGGGGAEGREGGDGEEGGRRAGGGGKGKRNKQPECVPYVAGFQLPTPEEIVEACGSFPWANDDPSKRKHREDLLLGKGGGGKTTRESIGHLDTDRYYHQDTATGKIFWSNLPPPADDSSWLAQVNEPGQTFEEYVKFLTLRSGKFKPNSNPENPNLYLLPISEDERIWPQSGPDLDGIVEYVSAFFCREVIPLDFVHLRPNPGRPSRKSVIWKTGSHECEITGRISTSHPPRFQCHVDGLLTEIAAVRDDGSYNGREISNAFALVGITMSDLYSGDPDLFIAGMAAGGSKVAVLSLARYHPHVKMCPFHWDDYTYLPSASSYSYHEDNKKRKQGSPTIPTFSSLLEKSKSEYIRRAGKLIVHEICHVYGIDHCIHYHCLMNGTGRLFSPLSSHSFFLLLFFNL